MAALQRLTPHLLVLNKPAPTAQELKAATDVCTAFMSDPAAPAVAELLLSSPDAGDGPKLYALKVLSFAVASRGGKGDASLQGSVLELLKKCVTDGAPAFIREKLAAIVADLAAREFPQRWPGMIEQLNAIASAGPALAEVVAIALATLATDCSSADFNSRLPAVRRGEVLQGLTATADSYVQTFMTLLQTCLGSLAAATATATAASVGAGMSAEAAIKLASRIVQLMGTMVFAPVVVQRTHSFAAALHGVWITIARLQSLPTSIIPSFPLQKLVESTIQTAESIAVRKYDSASDYDLQTSFLNLLVEMSECCIAPGWQPLSSSATIAAGAVKLDHPTFRLLAGAVSNGGSHLMDPVVHVASKSETENGAAARLALQRCLTVAVRMMAHPSLIVKTAVAETLCDVLRSSSFSKLSGYAAGLQEALPPLLLPVLVKEARFVRFEMRTKLRRTGAATAGSFVPKLPPGSPAAVDGGGPVDVDIRETDFSDDEADEYLLCYETMRARATALLKSLASSSPATTTSVVCGALRELMTSACAPGALTSDAASPYGCSTLVSSAVRRADALIIALDALLPGLPKQALQETNGPVLSAIRSCGSTILSLIPSAADPLIRIRLTHAVSLMSRWFEVDPSVLQQVLQAIFTSIEFSAPPALHAAATAADASGHSYGVGFFQQHLAASCQFVRQRACQQLAYLSRAIPRVLLPALQALASEAFRLLSSAQLEPADEVSLYEVLILISNALAASDAAAHSSFVSQLLAHPLSKWTSPELTAAVTSPSALLQYLFSSSISGPEGVEQALKRMEGLVHQLHLLWSVARRCSAAEVLAAVGDPVSQQKKIIINGLPPMPAPTIRVHPFAQFWPQLLPNLLALLRCVCGLWAPDVRSALLAPPSSPAAAQASPLSVLPRYLLATSREEMYVFGRTGRGDAATSGASEDSDDDDDRAGAASTNTALLPVLDPSGGITATEVPVAPGFQLQAERVSAFSMRCLWHAYAMLGFSATNHILSPQLLHASPDAGGSDPAAVTAVTSAGLYSGAILGTAWPQLSSLLSPDLIRHMPLRLHRMMLQQLLPELLAGCPVAPAALSQVLPLLAQAAATSHAALSAPALPAAVAAAGHVAYNPAIGVLLPDYAIRSTSSSASHGTGATAVTSPASALIDGVVDKIRRDVQRSLIDVAALLIPAPVYVAPPSASVTASATTADGTGPAAAGQQASSKPPGSSSAPNALLPTASASLLTPSVAMPLAAALSAAIGWGDTAAAQKACSCWLDRVLHSVGIFVEQPPHQRQPEVQAALSLWVDAAVATFRDAVRVLVLGSPFIQPIEWDVIALATDIYCRLSKGFAASSSAMADDLITCTGITTQLDGFLGGLQGYGEDQAMRLNIALGKQGGEKERRHAMRDALQSIAATSLPPSVAADLGIVASSSSAVRPAALAGAAGGTAVKELPEKLLLLGRRTGGRGSAREAESAPLDEDTGLGGLFGASGDL